MRDKEFLTWIYMRLKKVYDENPNVDYMCKLISIIEAYPEDKITPNTKWEIYETKNLRKTRG